MFLGRTQTMRSFFSRPRIPAVHAQPARPLSEDLELLFGLVKGVVLYCDAPPAVLDDAREQVLRFQTFETDCLRTRLALRSCLERALGSAPTPYLKRVIADAFRNPLDQELERSLNRHEVRAKRWALDSLLGCVHAPLAGAELLGGGIGLLAALVLERVPLAPQAVVTTVDASAEATERAARLLADDVSRGRAVAVCGDELSRDYRDPERLLVNLRCERLADLPGWLTRMPARQLLLLQSNGECGEPGHDLSTFERRCALGEVHFRGSLECGRTRRFMLIGRK